MKLSILLRYLNHIKVSKKTIIQAASVLLISNAMHTLTTIAKDNESKTSLEYLDNMYLISMIGSVIATGKDKQNIIQHLFKLTEKQEKEDKSIFINNIRKLL